MENVPGLAKNDIIRPGIHQRQIETTESLTKDGICPSSGLLVVLGALSECGYKVDWKVYNAALLVPQMRERIYIVGIRQDLNVAHEQFAWPELVDRKPKLQDILHGVADKLEDAELESYRLSPKQWAGITETKYFQNRQEHRLPPLSGIANTLRGSYYSGSKLFSQFVPMPSRKRKANEDEEGEEDVPYRFFTPRECARLQGFPDSFHLSDEVPLPQQYQALGNAVPVPVVAMIAEALLKALGTRPA